MTKSDESFGRQFRELLKTALPKTDYSSPLPSVCGWLNYGPMRVYIRIGYRLVQSESTLCVQVANIDTPRGWERRGLLTGMLAIIRGNTTLPVLLEGCRSDFANHLLTKGWKLVSRPPLPRSTKDIFS
jgi:hypothetical protein